MTQNCHLIIRVLLTLTGLAAITPMVMVAWLWPVADACRVYRDAVIIGVVAWAIVWIKT